MTNLLDDLRQIHNVASAELAQMKGYSDRHDRYEEYERGYANGYEEVLEIYENLVDDINKLLRDADMESVRNSKPVVSEKQYPLLIELFDDKEND